MRLSCHNCTESISFFNWPSDSDWQIPLISFWTLVGYIALSIPPRITFADCENNSLNYLYLVFKMIGIISFVTILYMSEVMNLHTQIQNLTHQYYSNNIPPDMRHVLWPLAWLLQEHILTTYQKTFCCQSLRFSQQRGHQRLGVWKSTEGWKSKKNLILNVETNKRTQFIYIRQ